MEDGRACCHRFPRWRAYNPPMKPLAIVLAAALAYSSAVCADVYRCTVGGRLVYTDTPCNANAVPADLPPLSNMAAVPHPDLAKQYDAEARQQAAAVHKARAADADAYARTSAREAAIRKGVIEGRVVAGMTPAQVESILNLPTQVVDQGGPHERWIYRNGRERRTVVFKNGVVNTDRTGVSRSSR